MKKAKVINKSKKILCQEDILSSFNEMINLNKLEPDICEEKFDSYKKNIKGTLSMMKLLADKLKDNTLKAFSDNGIIFLDSINPPTPDKEKVMDTEQMRIRYMMAKYDPFTIAEHYKKLKDSQLVSQLVILCSKMSDYDVIMKEKPDTWITDEEHSCTIFDPISNIDLLAICNSADKEFVKYIHFAVSLIYKNLRAFYTVYSTPDVDVEKMEAIIMASLEEVKKNVPRCEKAFRLIEKNTFLFKENFGTYWKDYQQSGSKVIILENFITDVSNKASTDTKTMRQFKKLIKFIKDKMENTANLDPRIRSVMNLAEEQIKE